MGKAFVAGVIVLLDFFAGAQANAKDPARADSYSGELLARSTLTGDWGGTRNDLADKGVTFDANLPQVEQGVVSGDKLGSWKTPIGQSAW
jgi:hypothetical protein